MGDYEDFIKTLVEQGLDPYTTIDERLDFLGPKVVDALDRIKRVEIAGGIIVPEVKKIRQLKFDRVLAVAGVDGSVATIYQNCPFDGYIKLVTIHWPDGSDALVDVAVAHSNTVFCPRGAGDYLALNDATPSYPFNEGVSQGEEIWVEMRNRDGGNEHSITVTVSVEEK